MNDSRICIIGGGDLGQALHLLLRKKGLDPLVWDKEPEKRVGLADIKDASNCSFFFMCLPSDAMDKAAGQLKQAGASDSSVVVSCAKGLDPQGYRMDQVLGRYFPADSVVLLSGPMLAAELRAGKGGSAVAACLREETAGRVADLFKNSDLEVFISTDVIGTAWCGVLKNIYAMALGAADGFGAGADDKGKLISAVLLEMEKLVPALGGRKETVLSVAGVGDLVTTGFSPLSRNYKFGFGLANGRPENPGEGYSSLPHVAGKTPLLSLIDLVLKKKADASRLWE